MLRLTNAELFLAQHRPQSQQGSKLELSIYLGTLYGSELARLEVAAVNVPSNFSKSVCT